MLETDMEGVFPGGQSHTRPRHSAPLTTIFAEYLTGDQFSDICRVALAAAEDDTSSDDVPGEYILTWKRYMSYSPSRSDVHV